MSGRKSTRSAQPQLVNLVGPPEDLPLADLPTRRNVLQKMMQEKLNDPSLRYERHIPTMELAGKTGWAVLSLWTQMNTQMTRALVKEKEVVRRVFLLWTRMEEVASGGRKKASGKRKKYGQAGEERKAFMANLDQLFDIVSCQCPILSCSEFSCSDSCKAKVHTNCSCPKEIRIPELELEFINDQRRKSGSKGKLMIAGRDKVETARQQKLLLRQQKEVQRKEKREVKEAAKEKELFERHREHEMAQEILLQEWEESLPDQPATLDANMNSSTAGSSWAGLQNREHFPLTVLAAMRGGVSQRTLANILSSFAVDMGLATKEDPHLLVDQAKVSREQEREMTRLIARADDWMRSSGIDAILFDGKDEKAKAWVTLPCGTKVIRHVKEDHISLTDAEGEFLMHFTREKVDGVRAGQVIALRMSTFLKTFGIDSTLKMIGADSTNLNTGSKEGAIALLEKQLGKRLVWSICMLHTNELPLRHLIKHLDGPTGSGNTLTGPAGKLLPQTQSLPYNPNFTPLSCGEPLVSLPPKVLADLSWDQQYGYKMIQALEAGSVPHSLQIMVIGPLDHARWLTTANRFLDLWTRHHGLTGQDKENLRQICLFIVGVYYKQWFAIKRDHKLVDGPRHMLKQVQFNCGWCHILHHRNVLLQVQLVKEYCTAEVRSVVDFYVNRNAYFANPELMLITMLASEDESERRFAVKVISTLKYLNCQSATFLNLENIADDPGEDQKGGRHW